MRKYKIGTKHFEGIVDITDPCYSKGTWCRMTAEVKAGEYACNIWRHTEKYWFQGAQHDDVRVGKIGIYRDGIVPNVKLMQPIGSIGVDAGLAGFFMNKPDYNDEEWDEFCASIYKGDSWIKDEGFFSSSGYGDGHYPVYAYKIDNEIVALEIRFL
jgi:hypothetical protein